MMCTFEDNIDWYDLIKYHARSLLLFSMMQRIQCKRTWVSPTEHRTLKSVALRRRYNLPKPSYIPLYSHYVYCFLMFFVHVCRWSLNKFPILAGEQIPWFFSPPDHNAGSIAAMIFSAFWSKLVDFFCAICCRRNRNFDESRSLLVSLDVWRGVLILLFQSWTAPGRSVSWIVMGDPEIKNGGFWWENHGNILGNTVDIYVKYGKYSIFMYFFILGQWSINVDVPWCSTFDIPGGCSGHGIQILQSPPSGFCKWYSISGLSMLC